MSATKLESLLPYFLQPVASIAGRRSATLTNSAVRLVHKAGTEPRIKGQGRATHPETGLCTALFLMRPEYFYTRIASRDCAVSVSIVFGPGALPVQPV